MGIELAEQGGWGEACLPDVIVYPTGGGTGIVGMRKAFDELEALGWIGSQRPKMVVVQADGCAPIVRAFQRGERFAEPWAECAHHRRRPARAGCHRRLPDPGRRARHRRHRARRSAKTTFATRSWKWVAWRASTPRPKPPRRGPRPARLRRDGFLSGEERVVLFCTGMGLKYPSPSTCLKENERGGGRPIGLRRPSPPRVVCQRKMQNACHAIERLHAEAGC